MPTNDGVITALDIAERDGFETHRAWIMAEAHKKFKKGHLEGMCTGETSGDALDAYIDWGRWSARCPNCGGTEYVDPGECIFYCFNCGNGDIDNDLRPVSFIPWRPALEKEIMKRPVDVINGMGPIESARHARPRLKLPDGPISQSWPLDHDKPRPTLAQVKAFNRKWGIE